MPTEPTDQNQTDSKTPTKTGPEAVEKVTFTEEELRAMDAEGLTLGDAIRAIEARLG